MKSDPLDILRALRLSRATVTKMKQNLIWASIYNLLAIPVAAGALYPRFGIMLQYVTSSALRGDRVAAHLAGRSWRLGSPAIRAGRDCSRRFLFQQTADREIWDADHKLALAPPPRHTGPPGAAHGRAIL
jgi:hypothetical protein